jgi:hypothetical protein
MTAPLSGYLESQVCLTFKKQRGEKGSEGAQRRGEINASVWHHPKKIPADVPVSGCNLGAT